MELFIVKSTRQAMKTMKIGRESMIFSSLIFEVVATQPVVTCSKLAIEN